MVGDIVRMSKINFKYRNSSVKDLKLKQSLNIYGIEQFHNKTQLILNNVLSKKYMKK